jgi:hypothetical protein
VNSKCSETPVSEIFQTFSKLFDPKTGFFDSKTGFFDPKNRKLLLNYFCEIFASSKRQDISEKFPNFKKRTIPKLAKTKISENSV